MAQEGFLHGVEVVEVDDGLRPIQTVRSSIIGLVGTAPAADDAKFPYNTPVLIAGNRREAAKLGTLGTLPWSIDGIFDQVGAMVVVIRVPSTTSNTEELTRGVAPAEWLDPLPGAFVCVKKVYNAAKTFVEGTDYTVTETGILWLNRATATRPDNGTTYNVAYETDLTAAQVKSNIIGGVDNATGNYKGVHALLSAQSSVKLTPKVLIVPGFTHEMAVVSEMLSIADRLRAVILADGPNTNDADAISYREQFGSARVYLVDPHVKLWDATLSVEYTRPTSPRVAGIIAKVDNERGFWWSPSNNEIYGVTGTARPIDFSLGDPNARANYLNSCEVATVIQQNGYRLWGNRTCAADQKWAFLNVRRTADMINESIMQAHLWAVDRNISKTYITDVLEGVNAYIRHLRAVGAIINGKAWADPELNTPDQIMQGKVYIDFDFSANYPAEHLIFRSHLVDGYLTEIFAKNF